MALRVNYDGLGDDPDEYWFECGDCAGSGVVRIEDEDDENASHEGTCPVCYGQGCVEGDASDV